MQSKGPSEWDHFLQGLSDAIGVEIASASISDKRTMSEIAVDVLRAKLLPLLEAGQASEELLESSVSHVSHGGPTRAQAEAAILMYKAAKNAVLVQP